MIHGYALVSTEAQELDSLSGQLKAAGCERLFLEKVTGEHARNVGGGKDDLPPLRRPLHKPGAA